MAKKIKRISGSKRVAKESIDDVLDRAMENRFIKTHRGATDEDVRVMLNISNHKFPASYIRFIQRVGYLDIAGSIVLGLGPDTNEKTSSHDRTSYAINYEDPSPGMKQVIIYEVGNGDYECLDCSKIKDGDCPVVLWDHEHPDPEMQKPRIIKRTFTSWLAELIDNAPGVE